MREWMILVENWMGSKSIDQLAAHKREILANLGTQPDEGPMCDIIPEVDEDDPDFLGHYFDYCINTFRQVANSGHVTVYRALSVDDVQAFLAACETGKPLGNHWTYQESSASTHYHSEARKAHEVLLIAQAPIASVDWVTSLQQHFSHPYECELFVTGPVLLTTIWDETEGEALANPNTTVNT